MVLTKEQVEELKKQLSSQIQHLPLGQKEKAQAQIDEMSAEALELMLKQQQEKGAVQGGGLQKGIFRMIVDGDVPSKKVDENKDVVAVVSKRAVSKGHVLIIPKKVVADSKAMPNSAFTLAKKIAKKMSSKLKAKNTEIKTSDLFGEIIIDVVPVYDKPIDMNQSYEVSDEEMEEVYKKMRVVKKEKVIKVKKKSSQKEEVVKLKRRIP